jgi:flagellar FliL protein
MEKAPMAEAEPIAEAAPPEPKRKGGVLPLLAALVVTAGGGTFAGQALAGPKLGAVLAARAEKAAEAAAQDAPTTLHVVDNLVVNPAGSGGSRFLLATVAVQLAEAEDQAAATARDMEIRDAFTLVLGACTVEQLTNVHAREALTQELFRAAERVLGSGTVRRVLIPQFVVQ